MLSSTVSCLQAEIEGLLGVSLSTLFENNPSQMRSIPIAAKAGGFKLQQRAVHVFAEAQRVRDFQTVCNNQELSQDSKLQQLGDIMDASQASCRSDMSCNTYTVKLACARYASNAYANSLCGTWLCNSMPKLPVYHPNYVKILLTAHTLSSCLNTETVLVYALMQRSMPLLMSSVHV